VRFLFFDRIVEMELGKHALATKAVPVSDEYFPGHYERRAVMPPTLVLECIAQLGGWLNIAGCNMAIETVLALVEGVRFYRQVRAGDSLTIEVWMLYSHKDGATLRGEVRVGDELAASVERMVFGHQVSSDESYRKVVEEHFRYLSGEYRL
jgi:3-hydroxyacyl-[acyl-carrier-protein] dehydratase